MNENLHGQNWLGQVCVDWRFKSLLPEVFIGSDCVSMSFLDTLEIFKRSDGLGTAVVHPFERLSSVVDMTLQTLGFSRR